MNLLSQEQIQPNTLRAQCNRRLCFCQGQFVVPGVSLCCAFALFLVCVSYQATLPILQTLKDMLHLVVQLVYVRQHSAGTVMIFCQSSSLSRPKASPSNACKFKEATFGYYHGRAHEDISSLAYVCRKAENKVRKVPRVFLALAFTARNRCFR